MVKVLPSVGTDWVKYAAGSAPLKVIWAWNWRASALDDAGAPYTEVARKAMAAAMVKVCMMDF